MTKPTHVLKMKSNRRDSKDSGVIAVGWQNEDGSISLKMQMGTTLHWRDMDDCILTLFTTREENKTV